MSHNAFHLKAIWRYQDPDFAVTLTGLEQLYAAGVYEPSMLCVSALCTEDEGGFVQKKAASPQRVW